MATARIHTVDPDTPGNYHVITRCVRQSWLLGVDRLTGRNFDHRKVWVEDRIKLLAQNFSIGIYAYSVMCDHMHLVLSTDPSLPYTWDDEEVLRRWYAVSRAKSMSPELIEKRIQAQIGNSERIAELRSRLGSLSWFMSALSEPIARAANAEDSTNGRFWQGRFYCQALLDEAAMLSAMVYADLNPLRAGIVDKPEDSPRTSIRKRCEDAAIDRVANEALKPIAGPGPARLVTTVEYLKLVDLTGRIWREDKSNAIPAGLPPILNRLDMSEEAWLGQVKHTRSGFFRAIGSVEALMERAEDLGQRWLKGINLARRLRLA